ncbi:MAG: hypothetical protein COW71_09235 [Ignavibacteriales bacterium CG18_big_fil_WC_8_21_14_2_50_31_20]|nr:MAG: hypothetical protein COW71_09235 [Ignavibacteriales bacterium CG18_big_fil_WC_8_21_14_2_50_31_20]
MKYIVFFLFATTSLFSQQLEEFRGVKITDVDSRVLYSDQNIAEAMDYLASINVNAILVVVLNGGYTQYPSGVMDSLFDGKNIDPSFQNRDPLDRIIIEAHRNGIEVYPWFEYGFASHYSGGTPPLGGHILDKYPDWALRTKDNLICTKNGFDWMSAINPEVQNFINSLVKEVIINYDVDGIEFSDRIPALPIEGGYDSVTVSIYKKEHNNSEPPSNYNDASWKKWRADKLNEWYKNVRTIIKEYDKNIMVASSPSVYPWSYDNYLQDVQTWLNEGITDHFIPQLYRYSYNEYLYELEKSIFQVGDKREILFPGFLLNIGTGDNLYVMSPNYLLNALKANRDRGINGEVYFFYEGFRKNDNLIGDTLKATYYKEPAKIPLRSGNIWRPKAEVINENDDNIIAVGDWKNYPMPGFEGQIIRTNEIENYNFISYSFKISKDAYYDLYTYMVPNTNLTQKAIYNVFDNADSTEYFIDQSDMIQKGWQKLATVYLSEGYKQVLKIDNSHLEMDKYLAADAAMLMINRKLSPNVFITDVKNESVNIDLPTNFYLEQNYPNPFNPSTTIKYSIPSIETPFLGGAGVGLVILKIYDILGREIKTLVNQNQKAGNYEVKFDAANLTSGVYFYRLISNSFVVTKKMLLLK